MKIILPILCLLAFYSFNLAKAIETQRFIKADRVEYDSEANLIVAKGNIEIISSDEVIRADDLIYDIAGDELWADGNVIVKDKKGNKIFGEQVNFQSHLKSGIIDDLILRLGPDIIIAAKSGKKVNEQVIELHKASFTPCKVTCASAPIWQIDAKETQINLSDKQITYQGVAFRVYGVPVFYTPYFSHLLPSAKAKSGLLVPRYKNNFLELPIYFRLQPNMDLTLTPRLSTEEAIIEKANKHYLTNYEAEFRHKLKMGEYSLRASYGRLPLIREEQQKINSKYLSQYYILANGDFRHNKYGYGLRFERASDSSYLKNYYNNEANSMVSKIYLNKFDENDYFLAETLLFQGLSEEDYEHPYSFVAPKIRTNNMLMLSDDQTLYVNLKTHSLFYHKNKQQLARSSVEASINKNIITDSGHLFNLKLASRHDIYLVQNFKNQLDRTANEYNKNRQKSSKSYVVLNRDIPEGQIKWSIPLVKDLGNDRSLMIEPISSLVIGKKHHETFNKFNFIDSKQFELSESNLFDGNHYSGIDFHEYGNRLVYGLNSLLKIDETNFSVTAGQYLYNHQRLIKKQKDYVGRFAFEKNGFSMYYRYRRDDKFISVFDEIGTSLSVDRYILNLNYSKIQGLEKYYHITETNDKYRQIYGDFEYNLTDNLKIGGRLRFDLSKKPLDKKNSTYNRIFYESIKVTYLYDCVSIKAEFYRNSTSAITRGILKQTGNNFAIGLKTLNM